MSSATATRPSIRLPEMPFLNRLLGGGLPAGKLIGLVGPSGGGKTALAVQISYAMASVGKRVLYIGIERNNDLDGRLTKLFHGVALDQLDPHEQLQRCVMTAQISPLLSLIDADHFDFSASLEDIVSTAGIAFDLIVIDQLELWIMGRRETPDQRTIKRYCTGLKRFAARSGIPVLLLHQTASSLKSESATRMPEVTDAMNSRSFGAEDVDIGLFNHLIVLFRQTVSAYAGRGVLAQLQVQILEDEQRVRQAEREDLRCIQQQDREMDRQLAAAEKTLCLLTNARFYAEGFHKHKGQWRKRRDA